jgi:hypothetical protein
VSVPQRPAACHRRPVQRRRAPTSTFAAGVLANGGNAGAAPTRFWFRCPRTARCPRLRRFVLHSADGSETRDDAFARRRRRRKSSNLATVASPSAHERRSDPGRHEARDGGRSGGRDRRPANWRPDGDGLSGACGRRGMAGRPSRTSITTRRPASTDDSFTYSPDGRGDFDCRRHGPRRPGQRRPDRAGRQRSTDEDVAVTRAGQRSRSRRGRADHRAVTQPDGGTVESNEVVTFTPNPTMRTTFTTRRRTGGRDFQRNRHGGGGGVNDAPRAFQVRRSTGRRDGDCGACHGRGSDGDLLALVPGMQPPRDRGGNRTNILTPEPRFPRRDAFVPCPTTRRHGDAGYDRCR